MATTNHQSKARRPFSLRVEDSLSLCLSAKTIRLHFALSFLAAVRRGWIRDTDLSWRDCRRPQTILPSMILARGSRAAMGRRDDRDKDGGDPVSKRGIHRTFETTSFLFLSPLPAKFFYLCLAIFSFAPFLRNEEPFETTARLLRFCIRRGERGGCFNWNLTSSTSLFGKQG